MSDFEDFEFFAEGVAEFDGEKVSFSATSPSGSVMPLLSSAEVEFYNDKADKYQQDYGFTDASDLLELDRLLVLELMAFRWSFWLLQGGVDYDNIPAMNLEKNLKEYSMEIRNMKTLLGIDKKNRDSNKASSLGEYLKHLLLRAEEFGIHRNEQIIAYFDGWNELVGKVTLYFNSTEEERIQFNNRDIDVLEWIVEKDKEINKIDKAFLEEQRYWIHDINGDNDKE